MAIIVSAAVMGLTHLPNWRSALRWPGFTLFFAGLLFFVTGIVVKYTAPNVIGELMERAESSGVPSSITTLGGDILTSLGQQLALDTAFLSLVVFAVGALLFGASFLIGRDKRAGVRVA